MLKLFTFALGATAKQVKLVVEISRTGTHASEEILPFTVDPADNFNYPLDMTYTGAEQQYSMG